MTQNYVNLKLSRLLLGALILFFFPFISKASTLSIYPATGVYQTGSTFNVQIGVDTQGKKVNAADGTLKFNPQELQVVSANRASSIFSLWTSEPTFSNSAGTVVFSGGSPTGYTGSFGNVMTVTFRVVASGTARVSLANGSVLAADGMGTNVLSVMNGGTYTLTAVANQPVPEVVLEYVPPANTPPAPLITSVSHGDSGTWSNKKDATLQWTIPTGVTAVRTLLDSSPMSIPTKVYDSPISTITLNDLAEGVSYFHLQFKNNDGWGKVAHYKFLIDTAPLSPVKLSLSAEKSTTDPVQQIVIEDSDNKGAPLVRYEYTINGGEINKVDDETQTKLITLPTLVPGNYTVVLTAYNAAGSSAISTLTFSIETFDAPTITAMPDRINEQTMPVIQGGTVPNAQVTVTLLKGNAEPMRFTSTANDIGFYSIIVDEILSVGVYNVVVSAVDQSGALSQTSEIRQFIVEEPGYITFGVFMINVLSMVMSLVSLLVVTILIAIFGIRKLRSLKRKVGKEAGEVLVIMKKEFADLQTLLLMESELVANSRKTKNLTKAEQHLVSTVQETLKQVEMRITKEATDVAKLADKYNTKQL